MGLETMRFDYAISVHGDPSVLADRLSTDFLKRPPVITTAFFGK